MSFSNKKLKIPISLIIDYPTIIFKNIRSTSKHKAARKRQCFNCQKSIQKKEEYINHQYKYDNTIYTINFCMSCF